MRQRLFVVLALTGVLAAPRDAAAVCEALGPYLGTGAQVPLGCPVHLYRDFRVDPSVMPQLTVLRAGTYVNATGQTTNEIVTVQVTRMLLDCQFRPVQTTQTFESLQHSAIVPSGVQVGDRVGFDSGWLSGIEIVAAGACPAPIVPQPSCSELPFCGEPPPPFESFEPNGCSARGGAGPALALALLGLLRWAPRRRRR